MKPKSNEGRRHDLFGLLFSSFVFHQKQKQKMKGKADETHKRKYTHNFPSSYKTTAKRKTAKIMNVDE